MAKASVIAATQEALRELTCADTASVAGAFEKLRALLEGGERSIFLSTYGAAAFESLVGTNASAWFPRLDLAQRALYHETLSLFPPGMAVLGLDKCLASAGNPAHVVSVLRAFVEADGLYRAIAAPESDTNGPCERLATALLAVPDRVANALQLTHAVQRDFFAPRAHLGRLAAALERCLALPAVPGMAARVLGRAGSAEATNVLLAGCLAAVQRSPEAVGALAQLCTVDDAAVEAVAHCVLTALAARHRAALCAVLGRLCAVREKARYILTHKFVFTRWFVGSSAAVGLGAVLRDIGAADGVLTALCGVWGTASVVACCCYEQQLHMTRVLIVLARGAPADRAETVLMPALLAVPNFIASSDTRVRALGLAAAVALSRLACPVRALELPVPPSPDTAALERLASADLAAWDAADDCEAACEPAPPVHAAAPEPLPSASPSQGVVPAPAPALDSDDDMEPYAAPPPRVDRAAPRFLRDCLTALVDAEPSRTSAMLAALAAVPALVRAQPREASELCAALVPALVGVPGDTGLPGFIDGRRRALAALAVAVPGTAGPILCSEFPSPHWTVRHRMDVLQALVDGALALSGEPPLDGAPTDAPAPGPAPSPAPLVPVGKTRRFASARRPVASAPNAFAPHAGAWFSGLARALHPAADARFLAADVALAAALLRTLAIVARCARTSPALDTICSALLEVGALFRRHADSAVRSAALYGVCTALAASPAALDGAVLPLDALVRDLQRAVVDDASPQGRALAAACLQALHDRLNPD